MKQPTGAPILPKNLTEAVLTGNPFERLCIDVVENDVATRQGLALEEVAQHIESELCAACADEYDPG